MAAWPQRVPRGGGWHWAGRAAIVAITALAFWRVANSWSTSGVGLMADALIIAIAVSGVNLITGYTGQLSLGHSAFFAIGAYTSLLLTEGKITTPFFTDNMWTAGWTLPVSAALCFVIGAVVGLPALRLSGIYLALTTLVFVEAVRSMLRYEEFDGVFGGSTGVKGDKYTPPSWTPFDGRADLNKWFLWLSAALLLLVAVLTAGLIRSRIGRSMIATRDNETAAAVMGVHLSVVKTVVFGLSGAITGVAGSLFGLKLGLVDPDVPLFGLFGAITFLVAMVIGGAAQAWGPLIGAVFYVFVNDYAREVGEDPDGSVLLGWLVGERTKIDGLGGVVFGVLLILFARFAPFGVVGTFKLGRSKVVQVVPQPPDLSVLESAPVGAPPKPPSSATPTTSAPSAASTVTPGGPEGASEGPPAGHSDSPTA
jgi:branched-chain amino acid transport system permease protein